SGALALEALLDLGVDVLDRTRLGDLGDRLGGGALLFRLLAGLLLGGEPLGLLLSLARLLLGGRALGGLARLLAQRVVRLLLLARAQCVLSGVAVRISSASRSASMERRWRVGWGSPLCITRQPCAAP